MLDAVRWLLTIELLGLAALPLAMVLFRSFPDRGYGLTKILGLLLVSFLNWWLGSVAGLGNQPALLWLLALALGAGGFALYRLGLLEAPEDRRGLLITIGLEEALFIAAFTIWALVRAQNGDIYQTEKPMDFMLLQVSGMTHSFPPPDAWLAGHTVNYYYLGYAIFATLGNLTGVDSRYGFNLANVAIFALGCTGAYSIALALLKHRGWAFSGTFALMLAGDLDGAKQFMNMLQSGQLTWSGQNLWCSTRVIDSVCGGDYHTITEFPIFSVLWNDLHPHLMALPFALLAISMACAGMLDERLISEWPPDRYLRLGLLALVLGALFPINSWDYPTYLALALAAWLLGAYRQGALTRRVGLEIAAVLPASLLLYLPYYLTVHLTGQGIGWRGNPSQLGDVLTVIGALLVPAGIFAAWRCLAAVLEPEPSAEGEQPGSAPRWAYELPSGWGWWAACVTLIALLALPTRTDLLFTAIIALAAYAIAARLRLERAETLLALGLIVAGTLVLLFGDYVYLKDLFSGGPNYRMNTVFKLYYQAWLLLAFAAVYAVVTIARALFVSRRVLASLWTLAAVVLAGALVVYPLRGVASQTPSRTPVPGLDGLAYLHDTDLPEYDALIYIRAHLPTDAVIAEAGGTDAPQGVSGEYWVDDPRKSYSKVSALTGRSTILGWSASHEGLWRGAATDPSAQQLLTERQNDIRMLYSTKDIPTAQAILRKYHARYVYVGPVESSTYVDGLKQDAAVLTKFGRFMKPVFTEGGVILYQVRD